MVVYSKLKHITFTILILVAVFCISANYVSADEVYLKNKDKISGEIIGETEDSVNIKTEAMGVTLPLMLYSS